MSQEQVWPGLHRIDRWYLWRGIFHNTSDLIYSEGQELRSTKQAKPFAWPGLEREEDGLVQPPGSVTERLERLKLLFLLSCELPQLKYRAGPQTHRTAAPFPGVFAQRRPHTAPQSSQGTGPGWGNIPPALFKSQRETHTDMQVFPLTPRCCPSTEHHKIQKTILYYKVCRAAWAILILAYLQIAWGKNSCFEKSYCNMSNDYSFSPCRTNSSPSPFLGDVNCSLLLLSATGKERQIWCFQQAKWETFLYSINLNT